MLIEALDHYRQIVTPPALDGRQQPRVFSSVVVFQLIKVRSPLAGMRGPSHRRRIHLLQQTLEIMVREQALQYLISQSGVYIFDPDPARGTASVLSILPAIIVGLLFPATPRCSLDLHRPAAVSALHQPGK